MVDLSMTVVNYRTYQLIDRWMSSYDFYRPKNTSTEVHLVDNASQSRVDSLSIPDGVIVHKMEENLGYAKACNYGASQSDSEYIGLFNSDTYFINDLCVDRCIDFMNENPDVGVVSPLQFSKLRKPRKFTSAGVVGKNRRPKQRGWGKADLGEYRDVIETVSALGSAMFIRRAAWDAIRLDPVFRKHWPEALGAMPEHFLYYEDTALCYAMPKFGYKVFHVGDQGAEMVHEWHKTIGNTGRQHFAESRALFRSLMDDWAIEHD